MENPAAANTPQSESERKATQPTHIELRQEIHELRTDISELKEEVAGLVQLWSDAKGFVAVVKWLSGLGISLAALIVAVREAVEWIKS